ncbi:MAG: deaminase [Gammaproteobacteria bacterium]
MNPAAGWRHRRLADRLETFVPDPARYPEDALGVEVCREALAALAEGNYGIGAVIADRAGRVVVRARNRVFEPRFASDGHAEMMAVSELESAGRGREAPDLTLVATLEPCPMCYTRLKISGMGRVLYLADDPDGGMVHAADGLPRIWALLRPGQEFRRARVSPELVRLARAMFRSNLRALRAKLVGAAG